MSPENLDGRTELRADEDERVADLLLGCLSKAPEMDELSELLRETEKVRDGLEHV